MPLTLPPIFGRVAVNVEFVLPEATSRIHWLVPVVAGSWEIIAVRTVKVFWRAVVRQLNCVEWW